MNAESETLQEPKPKEMLGLIAIGISVFSMLVSFVFFYNPKEVKVVDEQIGDEVTVNDDEVEIENSEEIITSDEEVPISAPIGNWWIYPEKVQEITGEGDDPACPGQ